MILDDLYYYNNEKLKDRYLVYIGIGFAILALIFQLYHFTIVNRAQNFSKFYLFLIFIPYAIYIFYAVKNNQLNLLYYNIIFLFFYMFTAFVYFFGDVS